MTYLAKPKLHHPSLPTNGLGLTRRDYEGSVSTLSKKTWRKRRALLKKRALAPSSISSRATRKSSSSISLPISLP